MLTPEMLKLFVLRVEREFEKRGIGRQKEVLLLACANLLVTPPVRRLSGLFWIMCFVMIYH